MSVVKRLISVLVLASSLVACGGATAMGPHPVNVALIRHQIGDVLPAGRTITSMGHATDDSAVVYTTTTAGVRSEEKWVKDVSGWRLETQTAIAN